MKHIHNLFKTSNNRRTFLKGAGLSLLLPQLDLWAAKSTEHNPVRMAFLHVPNGIRQERWKPDKTGKNFDLKPTLEPLKDLRNDFQLISGLKHEKGMANGDGAGDHARAQGSFLTGAQILKSTKRVRNGISIDQMAAKIAGHKTYLPSLELSSQRGKLSGLCDSGYSCVYQYNLSWRNAKEPMIPESSPQLAFNRMFVINDGKSNKAQSTDKSVLDYMKQSAKSLQRHLGKEDIEKLDQYFTSLREMERKAAKGKRKVRQDQLPRNFDSAPRNYADKIEALMDIMVLAWEADATRICSFIVAEEGSQMTFPEMGITGGHHSISHHGHKDENLNALYKIDHFYVSRLAYFLKKLKEKIVNGKSLLDQSMVLYGSGLGDGNTHSHDNLPILLAGHANGKLNPGIHRKYEDTPMCNLFLNMMDAFGTPVKSFADSSGRLNAL